MQSDATLQQLRVLQSVDTLEPPPVVLRGTADSSLGTGPPSFFDGQEAASAQELREMVQTAEFWIKLMEGEQGALKEEAARQRQRHQNAQRQLDAQALAIKELQAEKRRLREELRRQQQERDEAMCAKHLLQQGLQDKAVGDASALASRAEALQAELSRERDERTALEEQLVKVKVGKFEIQQQVDGMQALIERYEDMLRALNPSFEPMDWRFMGQAHLDLELDSSVGVAESSKRRKSIKTAVSKMMKPVRSIRRSSAAPEDISSKASSKAGASSSPLDDPRSRGAESPPHDPGEAFEEAIAI